MSEDLIERQNVEAILRRRVGGCYGDCTTLCLSCAATKDLAAVRAIPASCSHAERLARAADAWVAATKARKRNAKWAGDGGGFYRAEAEFHAALAAYRASAQPEPAVPAPCGTCVGRGIVPDLPPLAESVSVWEPRKMPVVEIGRKPCPDCRGVA